MNQSLLLFCEICQNWRIREGAYADPLGALNICRRCLEWSEHKRDNGL